MSRLLVVLGDQLTPEIAALRGLNKANDVVLLAEVMGECRYVPHHPQKIVLVLSAMRHFAAALTARGVQVRYVKLDDEDNTQTLSGEVARAVRDLKPGAVVATEAGEWRVRQEMLGWARETGLDAEIRPDTRFCAPAGFFARWAEGKRSLRMEYFYREMRRHHDILMEGDEPAGGKWNYDAENRKKLPKDIKPPKVKRFAPDAMTQEVMALVKARFAKTLWRSRRV